MSEGIVDFLGLIFSLLGTAFFIMLGLEIRTRLRRSGHTRRTRRVAAARVSSVVFLASGGMCAVLTYYYFFSRAFAFFSAA